MSDKKKNDLEKRLRAYNEEYEALRTRIDEVGFICKGSLLERWLPCGNPNCNCHKDPGKRHGPYQQISWKDKGKSVSYFLSPKIALLYKEWIDNYRMLMAIVDEMLVISRRVGQCIRNIDRLERKRGPQER